MGVTAAILVAFVGLVTGYERLSRTSLWADWTTLITNRARSVYLIACERLGWDLKMMDAFFEIAEDGRRRGEMDEAMRFLDATYDYLADAAPSLGKLVSGMGKISRMASAIAPTTPPPAAEFRDRHVRRLAWWGSVLHVPLVSSAERFRLRTYVLGLELRTLTRYLLESKSRLEAEPRADSPSWDEIEALVADYHTVTDETLASVRALLASADRVL